MTRKNYVRCCGKTECADWLEDHPEWFDEEDEEDEEDGITGGGIGL